MADYGLEPLVYEMNAAAARVARRGRRARSRRRHPERDGVRRRVDRADEPDRLARHRRRTTPRKRDERLRRLRRGLPRSRCAASSTAASTSSSSRRSSTRSSARRRSSPSRSSSRSAAPACPSWSRSRSPTGAGGPSRARWSRRSGTRSRTFRCSRSGSTAPSARRRCAPTSRSSRAIAPVFVSAYPNAGLPNAFGGFDETPESMAADLRGFAERGLGERRRRLLRDDAGTHPRDRGGREGAAAARRSRGRAGTLRLSGLEPLHDPPRLELHRRRRADERHRLAALREARRGGRLRGGARRRAPAGRGGREPPRREHGRGDARLRRRDDASS